MTDHTRHLRDLEADIAILGWLVEMLYVELLSRVPDGVVRIDDVARETSEHLTGLSWPGVLAEEQDEIVDTTLRSAERILGGIRYRVAKAC
ncbi:MAG: hypothetical protein ACR2PI_05905 [Hyphomicrobiaceae bacterium]